MALTKSWYTIVEAASKFGVSTQQLIRWVEQGLIRTDEHTNEATLLNADDILLAVHMLPSV